MPLSESFPSLESLKRQAQKGLAAIVMAVATDGCTLKGLGIEGFVPVYDWEDHNCSYERPEKFINPDGFRGETSDPLEAKSNIGKTYHYTDFVHDDTDKQALLDTIEKTREACLSLQEIPTSDGATIPAPIFINCAEYQIDAKGQIIRDNEGLAWELDDEHLNAFQMGISTLPLPADCNIDDMVMKPGEIKTLAEEGTYSISYYDDNDCHRTETAKAAVGDRVELICLKPQFCEGSMTITGYVSSSAWRFERENTCNPGFADY